MMPDRLDITWIVLIGLALATILVPPLMPRPLLGNAALLAFAAIKGRRIVLDFLDLRAAPPLWRGIVSAWIVTVLLFAWLASRKAERTRAAMAPLEMPDKPRRPGDLYRQRKRLHAKNRRRAA